MTENTITIDLSNWFRLEEVDEYATKRGVDRAQAIRELVNTGLSHLYWEQVRPT